MYPFSKSSRILVVLSAVLFSFSCSSTFDNPEAGGTGFRPSFLDFNLMNKNPISSGIEFSMEFDSVCFYPEGLQPGDEAPFPALLETPLNHYNKSLASSHHASVKSTLLPQFYTGDAFYAAEFSFDKGVDFYGGGEVTGNLLRNNSDILLWNTDNYIYIEDGGSRLYQSHPWMMGLYPDGSAFGLIFCSTYAARMKVTDQSVTFAAKGDKFPVIVIQAEGPKGVLKSLAELTGKMELPPLWSLGYQQCRWSYYPDTRVKEIADEFRSRKIPCDVLWMDIDYMEDFRVFSFSKKDFPSPRLLNDYLHQNKFKSVWMIDPGVKKDKQYSICQTGTESDLWVQNKDHETFTGRVWPGDCHFPDFTMPSTASWWADLYKPFMATGVDGVWNDMNEPSVFNGPDQTMPETNLHRGGGDLPAGSHLQYHNIYGMLMVKASKEGILKANPDKRPFVLSRANFLGGQRHAAMWTGDNESSLEHFRMSVPMSLTMGLSGQPFNGPDIGGFAGILNGKLMSQWMGVGVFFPFARAHAAKGTNNKEPWAFGDKVEVSCRNSIERRYALLPYLYTLFQDSSQSGLPVMQPLFMADPSDARLRQEQTAFLLGDSLMVVPRGIKGVLEGYPLDENGWKTIRVTDEDYASDLNLPFLKIKQGAILPSSDVIQSTEDYSIQKLVLHINPDGLGKAEGEFYHDSGDGFGYREGDFSRLRFQFIDEQSQGSLQVIQIAGDLKIDDINLSLIIYTSQGIKRLEARYTDGVVIINSKL